MWDQRYAEPGFAYGTEPNDFLRAQADQLPPGGEVICLADGEGRNGVFLAERGHRVTAVDLSTVGLKKAAGLAAERGVSIETVHADLEDFDLGQDRWDGVVSVFCHMPPKIRTHLHRKIVRGLRPGGVLILEAYSPAQLGRGTGGPPIIEMLYALDVCRAELEGLTWVVAQETERAIKEGRYHDGESAVIQLVGQKPR